jgi:hypothetical protein
VICGRTCGSAVVFVVIYVDFGWSRFRLAMTVVQGHSV